MAYEELRYESEALFDIANYLDEENNKLQAKLDKAIECIEFYAQDGISLERISGYSNATGKARQCLKELLGNTDELGKL